MNINDRIAALRKAMGQHNLDAYIIPSSDPHQSEYVSDHWKSREWISGFSGSAGIAILLKDHAALWTDSRYFIQAETQLADSEMVLHKQGIPHAPEHVEWLRDALPEGSRIGLDGKLFSIGQIRSLKKTYDAKSIELVTNIDLIPEIWRDRPSLPLDTIFEHDLKYAGLSRSEKIDQVREQMQKENCQYHLISTLDDIAWVLNLRGSDVACNPVFYSYVVIGEDKTHLFIEKAKVGDELTATLNKDGIEIHDYDSLVAFLKSLDSGSKILVDLSSTSNYVYQSIDKSQIKAGKNIIRSLKAIKNPTEIGHIRNAMLKDGIALTRLVRWMEETLEQRSILETEIAVKLDSLRRAQGDYHGESFEAIVGYNGNGAIVHYRAEEATCAHLKNKGMLLLDSGGQYTNGTTDITRTFALGTPTAEQKRNFTLVLKGHIALDSAKFPHGTTGTQLDTLARINLWKEGLNYGHGTGHGVGFFLNVHEPPQGFATNPTTSRGTTAVIPGMFTSNEPGFYKSDEYGIRIENLILCVEGESTDFGQFYEFETISLFPIDLNLVDQSILNEEEINWLNDYHQKVYDALSPLLTEAEAKWMAHQCRAILV